MEHVLILVGIARSLPLSSARRADIETFTRELEARGRARSAQAEQVIDGAVRDLLPHLGREVEAVEPVAGPPVV
jgi:hypothetical protein